MENAKPNNVLTVPGQTEKCVHMQAAHTSNALFAVFDVAER